MSRLLWVSGLMCGCGMLLKGQGASEVVGTAHGLSPFSDVQPNHSCFQSLGCEWLSLSHLPPTPLLPHPYNAHLAAHGGVKSSFPATAAHPTVLMLYWQRP